VKDLVIGMQLEIDFQTVGPTMSIPVFRRV